MYLPQLLKEYRKQKGLRQKEIAAKLGITREHYAQLENAFKIPSLELLDMISKLVGERLIVLFPSDDPFNRALMDDDVKIPDLAEKFPQPLHPHNPPPQGKTQDSA